jgi:hypothetical protein
MLAVEILTKQKIEDCYAGTCNHTQCMWWAARMLDALHWDISDFLVLICAIKQFKFGLCKLY